MGRSVRISWKTASALAATDVCHQPMAPSLAKAFAELEAAMKPKRAVRAHRKEKAAKRATTREETSAIREAVMRRADNRCECGCGYLFRGSNWESYANEAELDHFFPKGRTKQTVKACWALTRACHRLKTDNKPDRETWLRKFIAHADRHGFARESAAAGLQLEALELVDQAAALSREGRTP